MIARSLAIVAGALILAAMAHVTVLYTGGYGASHAWLTIAVAFGVACGSVFCGMAWTKGANLLAIAFALCIASGEAYNLLQSANRMIAATEAAQAPKREHAKAFAKAEHDVRVAEAAVRVSATSQRLADALVAKADADKAVTDKSAERGCRDNCRQLLQAAVDSAADEVTKARAAIAGTQLAAEGKLRSAKAALEGMTAPESPTPLADRLGMAPWALDLLIAALGSLAINGLACCLMVFGTHHARTQPAPAPADAPTATETIVAEAVEVMVERPIATAKPRLITDEQTPAASLIDFATRNLERAHSAKLDVESFYFAYAAECKARGVRALSPAESLGSMRRICDECVIDVKSIGGNKYLCGVRLRARIESRATVERASMSN